MTAPKMDDGKAHLDAVLDLVGEALEPTKAQQERTSREYKEIGAWLLRPTGLLARLSPDVFSQGSTRIGTVIRPMSKANGDAAELDLDAVAELVSWPNGPMELFNSLFNDLAKNERYAKHLQRKRRCVRIDFPGDFHLDVLPSCSDPARGTGTSILIPDRELKGWVASNPKGFAAWFAVAGSAARRRYLDRMLAKSIEPLPPVPTFEEKPVLTRVVQLMKRRRDVHFLGGESAPRSIILTTLAARFYEGEPDVATALSGVLTRLEIAISNAAPSRLEVRNPTDAREDFADRWNDLSYRKFVEFVQQFRREVDRLLVTAGLETLKERLDAMFAPAPVELALGRYRDRMRREAESGALRVAPALGIVLAGANLSSQRPLSSVPIPKSTHFGE
jgi:hypothetical protein